MEKIYASESTAALKEEAQAKTQGNKPALNEQAKSTGENTTASTDKSKQAVKEQVANSGSGTSEAPKDAASSSKPDIEPSAPASEAAPDASAPGDVKDATQVFAPSSKWQTQPEKSQKDHFQDAELVLPAIALKKMKMAMTQDAEKSHHFIAAFGRHTVKKYKLSRAGVKTMILANLDRHQQSFWQTVQKELSDSGIAAFCMPDDASYDLKSAARLDLINLQLRTVSVLYLHRISKEWMQHVAHCGRR